MLLGRLFQTLKPAQRGFDQDSNRHHNDARIPASVTEDAHTYGLLFPSRETLHSRHNGTYPLNEASIDHSEEFDYLGEGSGAININNLRIIIARDEVGALQKTVLYDSKPSTGISQPPSPSQQRPSSRQDENPGSPQREQQPPYIPTSPLSPKLPGSSRTRFNKPDLRTGHSRVPSLSSIVSPTLPWVTSDGSFGQRSRSRGNSISSMSDRYSSSFGNARDNDEELVNCLNCMFGSATLRESEPTTKLHMIPGNSRQARPYDTSFVKSPSMTRISEGENLSFGQSSFTSSQSSVNLVGQNVPILHGISRTNRRSMLVTRTFPFIQARTNSSSAEGPGPNSPRSDMSPQRKKMGRPRAVMCAVAILIELPESPESSNGEMLAPSTSFSSLNNLDTKSSVASSFGSDVASSWTTSAGLRGKSGTINNVTNMFDSSATIVLQHWDVLEKVLGHLQLTLTDDMINSKTESSVASQMSNMSLRSSSNLGSLKQIPRVDSTTTSPNLNRVSEKSLIRLSNALSTRQVVIGQNRWSVWRDEVRRIFYKGPDEYQSFFLVGLLSAFLSTHLQWIAPPAASMKQGTIQHSQEMDSSRNRTIIICNDRILARTLIFLLSTFLPTDSVTSFSNENTRLNPMSDAITPTLKPSTSGTSSLSSKNSSVRLSESAALRLLRKESPHSQNRKSNLSSALEASKRDSVTIGLTDPGISIPSAYVAKTSEMSPLSSSFDASARGNSASIASAKLAQNLKVKTRRKSLTKDVHGRPIEGYSDRRESSHDVSSSKKRVRHETSSVTVVPDTASPAKTSISFNDDYNGLDQMVNSLQSVPSALDNQVKQSPTNSDFLGQDTKPQDIEYHSKFNPHYDTFESNSSVPFKLSINQDDGFVDVDIPMSNDGSFAGSPSLSDLAPGSNMTASHESMSDIVTSYSTGNDTPTRVGGFLRNVGQDLALQSVPPYKTAEDDIRAFMINERNPTSTGLQEEATWIDVCSTIIADTLSGDIKRLTLRRLVSTNVSSHEGTSPPSQRSAGHESNTMTIEERFDEEIVTKPDDTLLCAVEKLVANSGQSSNAPSAPPSRSSSPRPISSGNTTREHHTPAGFEVPRDACRKIMLGALEQIVQACVSDIAHDDHEEGSASNSLQHSSILRREVCKWLRRNT